ncbi:MAG TPA: Ig-like domain repeat protein [Vicinamibacterales bacterium]|nr:Ig-like domain repeat protein [Vicinamibacterales bacterium]
METLRSKGPFACALALFMASMLLPATASAQWTKVNGAPNVSTCLLLTDGSVLCQTGEESNGWSRLIPDSSGNYANGTWTAAGSLPSGHGPLYYASAVLADGRVILVGGEYNTGTPSCPSSGCDVNLAAIFDPTAAGGTGTWTAVTANETQVGDSDSFVLPDGRFVLRHLFSKRLDVFNPSTLTFTDLNATGKLDNNSEENSTLLPDGTILVVDAGFDGNTNSEIYDPATNTWTQAADTIVSMPSSGGMGIVPEMGPQILTPYGTVYAFGATGKNAVYDTATALWSALPDLPTEGGNQMLAADAPGALLPNGNALIATSQFFAGPTNVYEFDGTTFTKVNPPNSNLASYQGRMLLLPTGQVLFSNGTNDVELYTAGGSFMNAWRPVITSAPANISGGQTYTISGRQFNGLSQANSYGDDAQSATNYPIVRIVNIGTGHVIYARTHDHSSMGVATGATIVSTQFDVPAGIESGPSRLYVVANGIPSDPIVVNGPDLTIAKTHAPAVFTQGDAADTFTIAVANAGADATSGIVTVADALPASLTATGMSGTGWSCNVPIVTCTRSDALASGSSYPAITLTVAVAADAPIHVTNTATVSGGGETSVNTTANDTAEDAVSIRQHTVTTVSPETQDYDDVVTLTAHVTPAGVAGSVAFLVNGTAVGTASYDSTTGVATLAWLVNLPSGSYSITATFTSADPLYLDSTGTLATGLTVTKEETTLSYTGDTVIANGGTAHMKGVLLEDGVTPIAGRTITFTLGTGGGAQTCNGVTDATGTASCAISPVAQPLGPGVVADAFAGDAFYLPASANATTILFAFLAHGGFVAGDLSAPISGGAAFWGAQWAGANALTGGAAPASFKGFAATLTAEPPACGIGWTTRPGNASNPPAGPLPSYMGVLISSGVQQSGTAISGNVVRIVVVHTGAGYDADPGHPGTGIVVAEYCH